MTKPLAQTNICWQGSLILPCYSRASPQSFWHLHWGRGRWEYPFPFLLLLSRGTDKFTQLGGREDHPLWAGPSHTVAPSPQGWCQLCAMPMLWTMHRTGTDCQNLVPSVPRMEKCSQKCKFTKKRFHCPCLLFHNLFMFLISPCWFNYVTLSTFAELFHLLC